VRAVKERTNSLWRSLRVPPYAPLSETGRLRLAHCVVDDGWSLRRAAERFQVSVITAVRWAGRYQGTGRGGHGRPQLAAAPQPSAHDYPYRTAHRQSPRYRPWGPTRIAYLLRLNVSTVHSVLTRYGLAKPRWLDRATGRVIRRIVWAQCGELFTSMSEKLGKIPVRRVANGGQVCRQAPFSSR
jgi:transposase